MRNLIIVLVLGVLTVGCSSVPYQDPEDPIQYTDNRDPFEAINRDMWEVNQSLDENILRPAAVGYRDYVNEDIRDGLYNMAQNLDEPSTVVNDILQLKFDEALQNTGRFVLNTTVGLLGFFDVARHAGLERNQEDFGQTMGVYGVGNGAYLMIPGLGPSAPRNLVGDYVDSSYWPLSEVTGYLQVFKFVVVGLTKRIELIDQEALLDNSLDSYAFVKNAYFDNMESKVNDGAVKEDSEEDFEDFEQFMDEFDELEELDSADQKTGIE